MTMSSQVALVVKNLPANAGGVKRCGFDPWVRKIPWKWKWQPAPVFLSGKVYGRRSLEGYCAWGCKEWHMAEWLSTRSFTLQGNHYVFFIHDSQSALYVVSVQEYLLTILRVFEWLNHSQWSFLGGFPGGLVVKRLPAKAEDIREEVQTLGQDDSLEEGMTTHSSILAWRTPPMDTWAWHYYRNT